LTPPPKRPPPSHTRDPHSPPLAPHPAAQSRSLHRTPTRALPQAGAPVTPETQQERRGRAARSPQGSSFAASARARARRAPHADGSRGAAPAHPRLLARPQWSAWLHRGERFPSSSATTRAITPPRSGAPRGARRAAVGGPRATRGPGKGALSRWGRGRAAAARAAAARRRPGPRAPTPARARRPPARPRSAASWAPPPRPWDAQSAASMEAADIDYTAEEAAVLAAVVAASHTAKAPPPLPPSNATIYDRREGGLGGGQKGGGCRVAPGRGARPAAAAIAGWGVPACERAPSPPWRAGAA
jgi:hypothetical protein